jgi:hypothetical protein
MDFATKDQPEDSPLQLSIKHPMDLFIPEPMTIMGWSAQMETVLDPDSLPN